VRKKGLLAIAISVLSLLLIVLIYFYIKLISPPGKSAEQQPGLKPLLSIYGYGKKPHQLLSRPYGVAVDKNRNIFITDTGNKRVLVFNRNGDFLFKFGDTGKSSGKLKVPLGIAVSPDGRIYVADRHLNKILVFNSKGKFLKDFKVKLPLVPVVANNKLYVATYGPVLIFDLDGTKLLKWGRRGRGKGEFDFPGGIAVDKQGNVYVSDTNNLRIQALNKTGHVIWIVGKPAGDIMAKKRRFGLPAGIALGDEGRIYLIDAFHYSIRILKSDGAELEELGERGDREGQFNLATGIAQMNGEVFVIADQYNDRVQVIQITPPAKLSE